VLQGNKPYTRHNADVNQHASDLQQQHQSTDSGACTEEDSSSPSTPVGYPAQAVIVDEELDIDEDDDFDYDGASSDDEDLDLGVEEDVEEEPSPCVGKRKRGPYDKGVLGVGSTVLCDVDQLKSFFKEAIIAQCKMCSGPMELTKSLSKGASGAFHFKCSTCRHTCTLRTSREADSDATYQGYDFLTQRCLNSFMTSGVGLTVMNEIMSECGLPPFKKWKYHRYMTNFNIPILGTFQQKKTLCLYFICFSKCIICT
jgi:hypothetical protein